MSWDFDALIQADNEWGLDPAGAHDSKASQSQQRDRSLLALIQGNILQPHRRGYAMHVMIRFRVGPGDVCAREIAAAALRWIARFPVTTAADEFDAAEWSDRSRQFFRSLGLSRFGYAALGIPCEKWPDDPNFAKGMFRYEVDRRRGRKYGTVDGGDDWGIPVEARDPQLWHELDPNLRAPIHAVVTIAHDSKEQLDREWRSELAAGVDVAQFFAPAPSGETDGEPLGPEASTLLPGHLLFVDSDETAAAARTVRLGSFDIRRRPRGYHVEHFGFRDGLSQPLFLKPDIDDEQARCQGAVPLPAGTGRWRSHAPLSLVLRSEAEVGLPQHFGSFLVFRKLEQDAYGFDKALVELARSLGLRGDGRELAGAMVFGRYRDGRPLIAPDASPEFNDFDFGGDPDGVRCPFHAHIRRTNPRGEVAKLNRPGDDPRKSPAQERRYRIVRRGIPYGMPWDGVTDDRGRAQRGLYFQSFQSETSTYQLLQKSADEHHFVRSGRWPTGIDGVIGRYRMDDLTISRRQQWPKPGSADVWVQHGLWNHVTFRGGEYFYVPSVAYLKQLGRLSTLVV